MTVRAAEVRGARDAEQVARYLPSNYEVRCVREDGAVVIAGEDNAGWTLDDYVIPRLASGLVWAKEIELLPAAEQTIAGGPCTLCAADSPGLLPWSGERICWLCFDGQLDLMAKAIREAGPGDHLVFGGDLPAAFKGARA